MVVGNMQNYREVLRLELEERCKRNPQFSMRAFARLIGLKAPHLSAVLSGQKGLSAASAQNAARALRWSVDEEAEFIEMVNAAHARNKSVRETSLRNLKKNLEKKTFQSLDLENFKLISDWHHFAILHLFELKDFQPNPAWISKRLGLSESKVLDSLKLLENMNLVNRSGSKWTLKQKFMATPNVKSSAIRHNHHQVLQLAARALEEQPIENRDFSTIYMAIKKESVSDAKIWLKDFRRTFCQKLDRTSEKDALYCLSIQFFELTGDQKNMRKM